jgi:pyruvate dehydrogenase E2 component (dihydrolipoamide acetyltransferase)
MPTVIMPKMGDGMEEGTLLRWLKNVGEEVDAGEPIAEIETDKVSLEIEAAEGGILTKTMVGEGETVPIGTPIATIGDADVVAEAPAPTAPEAKAEPALAAAPTPAPAAATPEPAPVAASATANVNGVSAVSEETASPTRADGERLRASPLVKRLAAEHGIDLSGIPGTGPGGRIVKDDLNPYLTGAKKAPVAVAQPAPAAAPAPAARPAAAPAAQAAPGVVAANGRPAGVVREMSRVRKTTGKRMAESKQVIPHFYVTSEVDMDAAMSFRKEINAQITDDAAKITFNDLIVKASALALCEFPNLNTTLENDTLYDHANIDVNIAVAIEGGLIAPFIADADQKSLGTIARASKDLANRARNGGLLPQEFQGGTFTISNLGMFDVEQFVAIINPPQAAILAIGSITETPVVKNGEIAIGHRMRIALSCDHRISDGAEVARFLISVKNYLQSPMLLAIS